MKYLICDINKYKNIDFKNFVKEINPIKREKLTNMNELSFKQSIIGEILLAKLLNENSIDYRNIIVNYNENGKPYIRNYPIYYNISHDKDFVICAINNGPIGIDILRMDDININIAKSFCTKEELNYIKNKKQFYQIFTLKEAYLKLFGKKINDIKDLNIIHNNKIDLNVTHKTFIINNYMISICYTIQ